jgi:putative component of toxin-antitoxin plasmid stabilization module
MAKKVEEYIDKEGRNHYREWFNSLAAPAAAKTTGAVARMEAGAEGGMKKMGQVTEWKIDWARASAFISTRTARTSSF